MIIKIFIALMLVLGLGSRLTCAEALISDRQMIKERVIRANNAREASPELTEMVHDALKACEITEDVIILEAYDPRAQAYAFREEGQAFIIFLPITDWSESARAVTTWVIYHEIGHVFLRHIDSSKSFGKNLALLAMPAMLIGGLLNARFGAGQKSVWPLVALVALFEPLRRYLAIADKITSEKEADLFACHHLIKHKKTDIVKLVFMSKLIAGHPDAHVLPLFSQRIMQHWVKGEPYAIDFDQARYLAQCLKEHGELN